MQQQWLHTLGNLTLTAYNAEYSDRPFAEKRDMRGGFKESPLKVNAGLGSLDQWNEAALQARAGRLSASAATGLSLRHQGTIPSWRAVRLLRAVAWRRLGSRPHACGAC